MTNRKTTIKQKQALNNLVADGGSVASAMVKAGYSPNTARTPKKFTNSPAVKPEVDNILERLEEERQRIFTRLETAIKKASYRDLIDGIDKLTKNILLLSGGNTENKEIIFRWSER